MADSQCITIVIVIVVVLILICFLIWWFKCCNSKTTKLSTDSHPSIGWNELLATERLGKPNLVFSKLADKLEAKKHTSLPTARVFWHTNRESDLHEMKSLSLPPKFAVKANHTSGQNILVTNSKPNWSDIEKTCKKWLSETFDIFNELHYRDITPAIFIEEYVDILEELKYHIFNGKVVFIEHLRDGNTSECGWYTREWKHLNVRGSDPLYPGCSPRPTDLVDIISIVESDVMKLGIGYYVRYDTIKVKDGLTLFGEFTFTPAGLKTKFEPESFELLLGSFLQNGVNDMEQLREYELAND